MRIAFINTLTKIAKSNKNVLLLTGDLGFSVFENYMEKLPNQFLNAGISEQNMTGMAAGMAIEGKIPYIFSIVPFVTMRNFEQIRNDICYQNLNVKIVGVGAGFSYGSYGHTHHGLEDIGILRTLPNLTIFSPGDPFEAAFVTEKAFSMNGPVYIRLGRAGEPIIHNENDKLQVGKGAIIQKESDICIFVTGAMLATALSVSRELADNGISVQLVSMHTIKPLDIDLIRETFDMKAIFSIEEHFITGGLGSAIAEVLAENGYKGIFKRFGVPDRFTKEIGDQEYMRKVNGLSADSVAAFILKSINHA